MDRMFDDVTRHVHLLKYADLSKRVDSLVALNDMIGALNDHTQPVLVRAANDLIGAFIHVLIDIFEKNSVEEINLRFAKYFISIVLKVCSTVEIMSEASYERVVDLSEQLLTKLLIENLDKVGENKEGETLQRNLNSAMLRILENCNHTYMICSLIDLMRKYKDYPSLPKMSTLLVKCLMKLSKIIEKLIDKLDIQRILLSMHEYMLVINNENRGANDEAGVRILKTMLNEFIKLRREQIWEAYSVIKCHGSTDHHINKWIDMIIKSLNQ